MRRSGEERRSQRKASGGVLLYLLRGKGFRRGWPGDETVFLGVKRSRRFNPRYSLDELPESAGCLPPLEHLRMNRATPAWGKGAEMS